MMTPPRKRKHVLILCTGNSCRSQMAEALINHEMDSCWIAASAGTQPADEVHPLAVSVLKEIGIDLSHATPTWVDDLLDEEWDLVITVCDAAQENCPIFPRPTEQLHIGFPDPAKATGSREERIEIFRQVRDAIRRELLPALAQRS